MASTESGRPLPRKLLFSAVGLGLSLSAAWVASPLLSSLIQPQPEPVVPEGVLRYDAELGWAPAPNAEAVSERTGIPVEYRINSRGLRDEETAYENKPGTFRIVLLGDSNTFGFGIAAERHYARILEGYFRDLDVVNLGVDGSGSIRRCSSS